MTDVKERERERELLSHKNHYQDTTDLKINQHPYPELECLPLTRRRGGIIAHKCFYLCSNWKEIQAK
jgi:hypothetical protein